LLSTRIRQAPVKEYGKEGNWMHNPLTVYQTVRDYAIYEVLEDKYALPFHDNEEAVLSLVDVNFNGYHLPSLFAYLDYNSLGYALVTNKYFMTSMTAVQVKLLQVMNSNSKRKRKNYDNSTGRLGSK
ncbi:hypothetical protein AAULH_13326, partial [Lactobacillus helveticus MTCC 5463]